MNNNNVADGRTCELRIWLYEFRLRITQTSSSRSRKSQRSIVVPLLERDRSTKCLLQISVRRHGGRQHERWPFPSKCTDYVHGSLKLTRLMFYSSVHKTARIGSRTSFLLIGNYQLRVTVGTPCHLHVLFERQSKTSFWIRKKHLVEYICTSYTVQYRKQLHFVLRLIHSGAKRTHFVSNNCNFFFIFNIKKLC